MLGTFKHSKYKNTGILFELLARQITADTLSGKSTKAVDLLKTHFVKSELGKEYRLYETLMKQKSLTEPRAQLVIETLLDASKKLNRKVLKREKYNLIKEIKNHYNLEEFFKTKLPYYKTQAAFYILLEMHNAEEPINPSQIVQNKITILEHLTSKKVDANKVQSEVLEEYEGYDKDLRILAYKILLEKFNGKYADLTTKQKQILQQYITSVDSQPKLREYYNVEITEIKKQLTKVSKQISNKVVKIKIEEVLKFATEVEKTTQINGDDIVNLLQFHELLHEIKKANG